MQLLGHRDMGGELGPLADMHVGHRAADRQPVNPAHSRLRDLDLLVEDMCLSHHEVVVHLLVVLVRSSLHD